MDSAVVIDQTVYGVDGALVQALRQDELRPIIVQKEQDILNELDRLQTAVTAIFAFDYVSTAGLALLRDTKRRFPSLPLLMVTDQHSEELAIWAFRARVWDYFYTPIDVAHLHRALSALRSMRSESVITERRRQRRPVDLAYGIPTEYRVVDGRACHRALSTAVAYIRRNYHRKISQKEIADACDMTTFQFSRLFREQFGVTFQEYLLTLRLDKARALLRNPNSSVTDACFNCGFNDPSYFARVFSRTTGITPSQYKAKLARREIPEAQAPIGDLDPHPPANRDIDATDLPPLPHLVHQYGNA